jgi:hypothetical protein
MGWTEQECAELLTESLSDPLEGPSAREGAGMLSSEVVRVPVQAILYLQPMAENGWDDRPRPRGHALPIGHVRYWQ